MRQNEISSQAWLCLGREIDCVAQAGGYYQSLPDAVLFDLDDTIIAYNAVTEEWLPLGPRTQDLQREIDMDRIELAGRVYSASHLTGIFTLRSGQVSNEYFDKYLFEADPTLLAEIAQHLVKLIPEGIEVLAGLEMGGIPVAVALSLQTGIPAAFVRKKPKEYGTKKFAEGAEVHGKRVCLVEDVVTTGGQIILSTRDLRDVGANVVDVLCVIERDASSREKLLEEGLKLSALFSMNDLLSV